MEEQRKSQMTRIVFGTAERYSRSQEQWKRGNPIIVNVIMERIPVQMELDTGALPLLPLMMYMYQENVLTCTDNRHMSTDLE